LKGEEELRSFHRYLLAPAESSITLLHADADNACHRKLSIAAQPRRSFQAHAAFGLPLWSDILDRRQLMEVDWQSVFSLSMSPLELIVRGSAVYWFLFLLFRFLLKRDVGAVGIADILLLVLVADAAQNAMAGEYRSVTDGFILVGTIIGWNYGLDYLAYKVPLIQRLVEPRAIRLVQDGRILRKNLRREMITDEELQAKLREHGIADVSEVAAAYMESDGEISVIKHAGDEIDAKGKKRKTV
jgi:uncharacterized membrane protein YcaP (DUF421 family)